MGVVVPLLEATRAPIGQAGPFEGVWCRDTMGVVVPLLEATLQILTHCGAVIMGFNMSRQTVLQDSCVTFKIIICFGLV